LVGGQAVVPVKSARNPGVLIDAELALYVHTSAVVEGCFYQLRQLRSVQRSLTLDARRNGFRRQPPNYYCNAHLQKLKSSG